MILVSSLQFPKEDVVPAYYTRQMAEMLFGFSKDDLGILPLRVHSELALSGFLFMQFITLIAFMQLKKSLDKEYTVEEALLNLRNLKCKVYDTEVVVGELTKQQKEIAEKLGIMVPKNLGI
jgi:transposase